MSGLSTHVLDTAAGRPAAGVRVTLETRDGRYIAEGVTDSHGRVAAFGTGSPARGDYVLRFDTGAYVDGFYPEVIVVFTVTAAGEHHHVPLLLSPYGYATYRGS
ncbi:hydroxyisourate hydrolase [Actinomadura sp. WMMA1423]|uniref:hydroxyisourate hydrolase n=1 Tax=Actinomadura sp. WMMA1423 TaxID=2591108 RepID=UPI001147650C|nr:hydroxyisourate hydrolase [Actinomadura sp. WMMA1423]